MIAPKLAKLLLLALWPLGSGMAAEVNEDPEVIVVTGRMPGPPLWKVSNGDNVLWIFPALNWIPRDMIWEDERVSRVIAQSQEFVSAPERYTGPPPEVRNPMHFRRRSRLMAQLERNPDGDTLEENLPPELYMRFAALQERYFPGNDEINEMRPLVAGQTMLEVVRNREGLASVELILKDIRRLVRRNRDIKSTEISVRVNIGDNFDEWAARMTAMYASFPPELEQACFEQQVRHIEEDLDEMKSRANSWAQGYIDEFRHIRLTLPELNTCNALYIEGSEREARKDMHARANQMWLDAVENALATNASTFTILPIEDLLSEDGLFSRLKAKGYEIREP